MIQGKSGAALLSIVSNSCLIILKAVAGAVTGSIAILTEAVHSAIDLIASIFAFASIRKAEQPADADHPYGHEKAENIAAGAEATLILVGALVIGYEAVKRLSDGAEIESIGFGIVVIAFSMLVNVVVSSFLYARARVHDSPALEGDAAHLRADAVTSVAVLGGLLLVEITDEPAFDSIAALVVAVAIVASGIRLLLRSGRILMDEAPPPEELDQIEAAIAAARPAEMVGYHKLRARKAGARRHIDMHVQFRTGTSLEAAHKRAHDLRAAIEAAIPHADVLIHVEPETSYSDSETGPLRHG